MENLAKFRTHHLSTATVTVYCASAWNEMGRSIYKYDYRRPDDNYNCIYDDKPLRGWWPWPNKCTPDVITPLGDESQLFPRRTCTLPGPSPHPDPNVPTRDPGELYLPRPPFELSARTTDDCFDYDDDDNGEGELMEKSVSGTCS